MEPLKEFSKTVLTLDNCIIPKERLLNTPSAKDGMSKDVEIDIRIKGCECIQSAGMLLKLPQAAMATAQILFHRFFYAKSIVKFKFYYAAMASLFLAAKIEECNRRLRDVLNVFHHLKQKRKGSHIRPSQGMAVLWQAFNLGMFSVPMDYVGEEYFTMRNTVNKYERYILKELGFSVHVQHPHKLVITCLQLLDLEKNSQLVQKAWNLMNDGLRTNIFVRYEVHSIACACILLASRQLKIPLPENPAWWKLFDVRFKDMKAISLELLALYRRKIRSLDELEKEVEVLKELLISQKKVEIKEIHVKPKNDQSPSLSGASPSNQSPATQQQPIAIKSTSTSPSKSSDRNPIIEVTHKSSHTSPSTVNGYKRDRNSSEVGSFNPQVEKKPKLSLNHQRTTPEAYRPILSPIKLSSGSSQSEDDSISPLSSQQLNGGSSTYTTMEDDHSPRPRKHHHHRHKHRSSVKHHRHNRRDKSRERSSDHHSTKHGRHRHREDKDSSRSFSRTVSMPIRSSEYDRRPSSRKTDSFYR